MENKKQLIIIPPMSDAVKKLHEVLEGIAADENIEITLIDDLKELTQFLNNTGQCLILSSNAKKCATFLQENRFFLIKNHCKTILFTPKEIPAKTLVKFTKIGLTESILENSPPKTFLYKVKLLLRSIKTAKPQEDAEKTIRSLEQRVKEEAELELKEREKVTVENLIDIDRPYKKDQAEGETIDYGNPLKGKVRPADENLDTHWKSDRKTSEVSQASEEKDAMAVDSELSAIDMYYRGKSKKPEQVEQSPDDLDKKMAMLLPAEEEEKNKKKNSFADVIEEGSMKQKRLENVFQDEEETKKISLVDLELTAGKTKKRPSEAAPDEMDDFDRKMAELMALEEERKKNKENEKEDLGGYLKGKVSAQIADEEEDDFKDEASYDNSELEDIKPKKIELDLIAGQNKKDIVDPEDVIADDIHEGEVDQIKSNMIGDTGTVDKIRTRMEGQSASDENAIEEEENLKLKTLKRKSDETLSEDTSDTLEGPSTSSPEGQTRKALRRDEDELEMKQKSVELDLTAGAKKTNEKQLEEELEEKNRRSLDPILEAAKTSRRPLEKDPDTSKKGRDLSTDQQLGQKSDNQVHNSTVEKIDTFYRGGEAAKKKDQDWGNLIDKKEVFDLLPGKGKRNDETSSAADKADLGEQTIDYRKMKEEFEMINSGLSATERAAGIRGDTTLKNDDDEGSFKVQEIDPKGLDFSIHIISSIYQKDVKPKQIFALLADELVNTYHCYPVFYTYKLSDKKFSEAYNPFVEIKDDRMTEEKRAFWNEFKKDTALFEYFKEKSMTTWRCPEIINNNEVWEDVELPSWAKIEFKSKKVELVFPYFDGIDRMGLAVVLFPEGLDPQTANGLLTVLEMARSLFLDTIQRYQVQPLRESAHTENVVTPVEEKKNVLSFFGGLFGRKKAG